MFTGAAELAGTMAVFGAPRAEAGDADSTIVSAALGAGIACTVAVPDWLTASARPDGPSATLAGTPAAPPAAALGPPNAAVGAANPAAPVPLPAAAVGPGAAAVTGGATGGPSGSLVGRVPPL